MDRVGVKIGRLAACRLVKQNVHPCKGFANVIEFTTVFGKNLYGDTRMEQKHSPLIEQLQARGMRVTPQRAIIFEAIERLEGHITAEEIFEQVQQVNPYVSLATVYRTLELLQELDLINQTNFGRSQAYFALKDHGPHHHLVCSHCGQIEEFSDQVFDSVRADLQARYGFQAHTDHMSIFGLCRKCQEGKDAPDSA